MDCRYYIINCGDYEISDGREISQLGFFIKTKLYKLRSERVKREITNLHRRRWRTTKVVKSGSLSQNPYFIFSWIVSLVLDYLHPHPGYSQRRS